MFVIVLQTCVISAVESKGELSASAEAWALRPTSDLLFWDLQTMWGEQRLSRLLIRGVTAQCRQRGSSRQLPLSSTFSFIPQYTFMIPYRVHAMVPWLHLARGLEKCTDITKVFSWATELLGCLGRWIWGCFTNTNNIAAIEILDVCFSMKQTHRLSGTSKPERSGTSCVLSICASWEHKPCTVSGHTHNVSSLLLSPHPSWCPVQSCTQTTDCVPSTSFHKS